MLLLVEDALKKKSVYKSNGQSISSVLSSYFFLRGDVFFQSINSQLLKRSLHSLLYLCNTLPRHQASEILIYRVELFTSEV